jgi:3-deoxy-D-manno-octulosonic-acid transferase
MRREQGRLLARMGAGGEPDRARPDPSAVPASPSRRRRRACARRAGRRAGCPPSGSRSTSPTRSATALGMARHHDGEKAGDPPGEAVMRREQGRLLARMARRAAGGLPAERVEVYVADTIGELGLFFRLAPVARDGAAPRW